MEKIIELLKQNSQVSDYKINFDSKESYELFFVKGKLETTRSTDTCDKEVTVYVNHGEYKGDSSFIIYPSTSEDEIKDLIERAVEKALLINNPNYELPGESVGEFEVESNLGEKSLNDIAGVIANAVFSAKKDSDASLNSVEVFVNKYTMRVLNSKGVNKVQTRYTAMVEAIPTYNGKEQSVELYQQYNFNTLDETVIRKEIEEKLAEVKARYEAKKPEEELKGSVILNKQELSELMGSITSGLSYARVFAKANIYKKGDEIQKDMKGDAITITMEGEVKGNVKSLKFDSDGMELGKIKLVENGKAINYYGSNRFGQYLGETPTGVLPCTTVEPGSACPMCLAKTPYLEVVSMSGIQVDPYNDYIGGEVRLAYYNDGTGVKPVTGISITGKLSEVLNSIRLSKEVGVHDNYVGPAKAILSGMQIF